jgi:hypothetical protein
MRIRNHPLLVGTMFRVNDPTTERFGRLVNVADTFVTSLRDIRDSYAYARLRSPIRLEAAPGTHRPFGRDPENLPPRRARDLANRRAVTAPQIV